MKVLASALLAGLVLAAPVLAAEALIPAPGGNVSTLATSSGQPIVAPTGEVQVTAGITELAAGASTPEHQHPWPRFVYVLSGEIRLDNLDTGKSVTFKAGEFTVDPTGQWHKGTAVGGAPVRLLTIDQVPPGKVNTVAR